MGLNSMPDADFVRTVVADRFLPDETIVAQDIEQGHRVAIHQQHQFAIRRQGIQGSERLFERFRRLQLATVDHLTGWRSQFFV